MTETRDNNKRFSKRLRTARGWVLLGLLVSVVLVGGIVWIAVDSFNRINHSVALLSEPDNEADLMRKISLQVADIQSKVRYYSITRDRKAFRAYKQQADSIYSWIDSLGILLPEEHYQAKLRQMSGLMNSYQTSMQSWLNLQQSSMKKQPEQQLKKIIEESDSLWTQALSEKDTTPTMVEEVIIKKGFLGKKKKEVIQVPVLPNQDSIMLVKADTILSGVKSQVKALEEERIQMSGLLSRQERILIERQLAVMKEIEVLLRELEQQAVFDNTLHTVEITANIEEAQQQLMIVGIAGLSLTILLIILILSDLSKSQFYKVKLEEAEEEALKLAQYRQAFLARMSHEIRTPLNSIIGFSEKVGSQVLSPDQRADWEALTQSGEHLLHIVNDILDLSKIEAGKIVLKKQVFQPFRIVRDVCHIARVNADKKGIVLECDIDEEQPVWVSADPVRLRQVLLNIIGNAIKFTEKGSVRVSAHVASRGLAHWIHFKVEDTGSGIPEEKIGHLFQEYGQLTAAPDGTGLGLYISKHIIELYNGKIEVSSEPGKGTCFQWKMSFSRAEAPAGMEDEKKEDKQDLLHGRRILVVDDDLMTHKLMFPMLDGCGVEVRFAVNGEEAKTVLQDFIPELIISDWHIPDSSEGSWIEEIGHLQATKEIPVLITTGDVTVTREQLGKCSYVKDILYKPYRKPDLVSALTGIFRRNPPAPAYSLAQFITYANQDTELLCEFLETFIERSRIELANIDQAISEEKYTLVGEIAHKLKNTFGQLQAVQALRALVPLEKMVHEVPEDKEKIRHWVRMLQREANLLFNMLEKEISSFQKSS